jgi:hypothetical protein
MAVIRVSGTIIGAASGRDGNKTKLTCAIPSEYGSAVVIDVVNASLPAGYTVGTPVYIYLALAADKATIEAAVTTDANGSRG